MDKAHLWTSCSSLEPGRTLGTGRQLPRMGSYPFSRNVSDPPDIRIIAQDLLIRRAPLQGQRVLCWDWTREAR